MATFFFASYDTGTLIGGQSVVVTSEPLISRTVTVRHVGGSTVRLWIGDQDPFIGDGNFIDISDVAPFSSEVVFILPAGEHLRAGRGSPGDGAFQLMVTGA